MGKAEKNLSEAEYPGAVHREDGDRQFASTLARGLAVLRCFTPQEAALGNKDISTRSGLSKPTVSRLTYTLTKLGYLHYNGKLGKYQLGSAVLSISYPLLASMHVRQIARPLMESLANYCNGVVSMAVRDRLNMIFIESYRANNIVSNLPDIGAHVSLAGTCTGRAFLAACTPAEREAVLNELRVKDPESYRSNIRHIGTALEDLRRCGYCISPPEVNRHTPAVAAPMHGRIDDRVIAFNCGVPSFLLKKKQLQDDLGPRLVAMIQQLEIQLATRA